MLLALGGPLRGSAYLKGEPAKAGCGRQAAEGADCAPPGCTPFPLGMRNADRQMPGKKISTRPNK